MAQLVEHVIGNDEVISSTLIASSRIRIAIAVRILFRNSTAHSFRRLSAAVRIGVGEIIVSRTFCLATAEGVRTVKSRTTKKGPARFTRGLFLVERRGFEPLTPTLPVLCAPNCANAPFRLFFILPHLFRFVSPLSRFFSPSSCKKNVKSDRRPL